MSTGRITGHLMHARELLAAREPATTTERRRIAAATASLDLTIAAVRRLHRG